MFESLRRFGRDYVAGVRQFNSVKEPNLAYPCEECDREVEAFHGVRIGRKRIFCSSECHQSYLDSVAY